MTRLIIRAIQAYERDEVFEPLQIVIVPVLLFVACLVYAM